MPWIRLIFAILAGGIVASMTDWLFMGDWLYKRFDQHPEIWRVSGRNEATAIAWASPLPFLTCACFAFTCWWLQFHSFRTTMLFALSVWIMAVLPLMIANALFIKISTPIAIAHASGWLVKLIIAAAAVALIVR
jgi:hypothetical protein